jgi:hypothetical protein
MAQMAPTPLMAPTQKRPQRKRAWTRAKAVRMQMQMQMQM